MSQSTSTGNVEVPPQPKPLSTALFVLSINDVWYLLDRDWGGGAARNNIDKSVTSQGAVANAWPCIGRIQMGTGKALNPHPAGSLKTATGIYLVLILATPMCPCAVA